MTDVASGAVAVSADVKTIDDEPDDVKTDDAVLEDVKTDGSAVESVDVLTSGLFCCSCFKTACRTVF